MPRRFYTLDVFTTEPLSGNPLAVVLDSDGLDDATMQAIAIEFNLSETVFVSEPKNAANRASLRIFTPAHELPFAGHPTVGTAILLNHLNHLGEGDEFVLEERVGPIGCIISEAGGMKTASFGLPKVAEKVAWEFDHDLVARALGVSAGDIGDKPDDVSLWDGGVPYTLVKVNSMDVVAGIQIDTATVRAIEPVINGIGANFYVYCEGGEAPDTDFHARMFAPLAGIPEDPATGSAVASMSGWIFEHIMAAGEKRSFKIEQGYEMGRASQIYLDFKKDGATLVDARISGSAVIVSEGILHI